MNLNVLCGIGSVSFALAMLLSAARAETPESAVEMLRESAPAAIKQAGGHPFAAIAGAWSGGGMIALTNDIREPLRCRANHTYVAANKSLSLSIRCASDNYKFELSSNVVERNGQISGTWNETTYNVKGSLSGRITGDRIAAEVQGESFNASLSLVTAGNRQSVSITPRATYLIDVQIALNRR